VEIIDIDRVVDHLLDCIAFPYRQMLFPLCDHGREWSPARIVLLDLDCGVAGVGLAEPEQWGANPV
jgi:hypothetical protein